MEDLTTITGRIIPGLLVNQLKALIKSLNETIRPAPHLKLGGNKAELIYRLTDFIVKYHQIGDQVVIRQIRQCVRALNQGDSELQLMVFCGWADSSPQQPILMEFPSVCEIKVNGRVLEANLRGMKNKPGTVSPANITRLCRMENADYNKVEFIYANSTKRYYASTHVVKKISVQSIIAEIERGKFLSKEKMLQMIEDRNKDDDIMATSSTLSLKCPLGFQRINIPCRSSYCHHLQCFDGITFFELNEQTPTWTCPVCSRVMHSWEEIVVDGYFKDILNSTPKSLESVTVQADGTWEIPASIADQPEVDNSPKKKAVDPASVFLLDDDSEDEEETAQAPPTPVRPTKPAVEVIDLISDSEDEEDDLVPALSDTNGDSVMQEAANSLQSMAHSNSAPHSVKTEIVDKDTPTRTEGPPPEIYSVATSAHASPTASSVDSPIISTRMAHTEAGPGHSPAPRPDPVGWDSGNADMFMSALLNPRRKRQFEDTVDNEAPATSDARQRIARLDIRSSASSDRSSVPSPDFIRRSTSSPTPAPIQDFYYQQSEGEDRRRPSRELFLNAGYFVENGYPGGGQTTNPYRRDSHRSLGSSRSVTKSPPIHHVYNNTMAHQPPDYYSVVSRPPSAGPLPMQGRSGSSVIASRIASGASSGPHYSGSTGWTSPDGHTDRPYQWPSESSSGYGGSHMNHRPSPRRVSYDELRSSTSSPGPSRNSQHPLHHPTYPPHPTHTSHQQHQRNLSNDEFSLSRQGSTAAPHHSHNTNSAESPLSRTYQHHQPSSSNVYSNGETPPPGEQPYPRPHQTDDANYFQGMRGARAR
ncbi:SUMO ligase siz1 [Podila clonocystis]|nr:SUMO ligase siz1 [Podila clonocystis]